MDKVDKVCQLTVPASLLLIRFRKDTRAGLRCALGYESLVTVSMPPPGRMPRIIRLDRPASEAVPLEPDSDFDDDPAPPPKKRAKNLSSTQPAPLRRPNAQVSRIDACGVKNLDRTVLAVRDAVPEAVVILCCLNRDITDHGARDAVDTFVPLSRDGSAYNLACGDDDLSEPEFMGLFASGPYDRAHPGVCDEIIARLDANPLNHVIVVDPSERGGNLARLAAGVAALKWRMSLGPDQAALLREAHLSALLKPTDAKWKAALARCARGRTWAEVRERARDWFVDN